MFTTGSVLIKFINYAVATYVTCLVFSRLFSELFNRHIQQTLIKICAFSKICKLVQVEARFQPLKFASVLGNSRGFCQGNQGFFPISIGNKIFEGNYFIEYTSVLFIFFPK